ncbi:MULTISPECIES: GntR family transcriptional regulator [Pacificimonas]|uniref:GntR family transcriptional regulator n=1 Tax=Pacificimonas aurantium TaxID=1250540 RepID=A0ABS7WGS1_9SPHN|nr:MULTISPECIES: GntR family transcriptional regulator [Pacificimonas]MBZ6377149.1 GntR family transcriptional regulator [Pacificimonas aurantium]
MARTSDRIVRQGTLRDRVYQKLRDDIRTGAFDAGSRLVEVELAERYGVSRTPIREALVQLAREGFVAKSGRGYAMLMDSQEDIADRLAVRELLDVAMVRGVATRPSSERDAGLERLYAKALTAHRNNRPRAFATAQKEFRQFLRTQCGNAVLAHHNEMVDDSFRRARAQLYEDRDNREVTLSGDRELIDALTQNDPDRAEAQTRRFLERVRSFYRDLPSAES